MPMQLLASAYVIINKIYSQHRLSRMQIRDFFKPYRQRIHDMKQEHDSLQASPEAQSPFKPYFGHMGYSPSPKFTRGDLSFNLTEQSPDHNSTNKYRMKQYNYNNQWKHTKLDREMHEPIWEHLYAQGLRLQREIQQLHKQKQFQIDSQCTFQPMLRKNSRYRLPTSSNFLERNYVWQENKLEKMVKQKEEEVVKDLQNCTFKPKLNKVRPTSVKYHHLNPSKSMTTLQGRHTRGDQNKNTTQNRDKQKQKQKDKQGKEFRKIRQSDKQKRTGHDFSRQEVGKIKNIIRNELKRIQL